ncbi:MAG: 1-deoxy-D-xylulose-5-phosphate reductoisomerase [Parasporobacterium sp.]|nr:1-deoxy-D-xylulose-5-phosphate reductoisomerase [Parasporobacterium sp.]
MKYISILGSTGSIGTQALQVIRDLPDLKVTALSANQNIQLLKEQILEFSPNLVCVYDENNARKLSDELSSEHPELLRRIKITSGMNGLIEAACEETAQIVLTAVVGMIGIRPTLAAIEAGKDIALANKETLVCAGEQIMRSVSEHHVRIYPVDSEHSAIFQSLNGENRDTAEKILLTASGGPFRGKTRKDLEHVTVEQALNHPNWKMGKKVTIDSSTLANKGLEVIEARWLFHMPPEKIQVLVHPQSIIHSAVQYRDGAVIAQLGTPDMKLPIQYAFTCPQRRFLAGERVDFFKLGQLTFEEPDTETFRALKLAYHAIEIGGTMPCVFNAANELAVRLFLQGKIRFLQIAELIEEKMKAHKVIMDPDPDLIIRTGEDIMNELC